MIGYFINYRCFEIRAAFESNITALRIPRSPGVALSIVYIILHNSTKRYIYIYIYMHKFLCTRYQYVQESCYGLINHLYQFNKWFWYHSKQFRVFVVRRIIETLLHNDKIYKKKKNNFLNQIDRKCIVTIWIFIKEIIDTFIQLLNFKILIGWFLYKNYIMRISLKIKNNLILKRNVITVKAKKKKIFYEEDIIYFRM